MSRRKGELDIAVRIGVYRSLEQCGDEEGVDAMEVSVYYITCQEVHISVHRRSIPSDIVLVRPTPVSEV